MVVGKDLISTEITKNDLEIYIMALSILKLTPPSKEEIGKVIVHEIPLSERKIKIVTTLNGTDRQIVGLFGKIIGEGSFGKIARTVDLVSGKFTDPKHPMAVWKTAKNSQYTKHIQGAAGLIELLHKLAGGKAPGIQDPLTPLEDGVGNTYYDGPSLDKVLIETNLERNMTPERTMHAAYQLAKSLYLMHKNHTVHGDIKPANILVRTGEKDEDWEFSYGDLDGAGRYDKNEPIPPNTRTNYYLPREDVEAFEKADLNRDFKLMEEIDSKSDVFAYCMAMYEIANTKDHPPFPQADDEHPIIDKTPEQLIMNDKLTYMIKDKTMRELIVKGMAADYTKRPSAEEIMNALSAYFEKPEVNS